MNNSTPRQPDPTPEEIARETARLREEHLEALRNMRCDGPRWGEQRMRMGVGALRSRTRPPD